MIGLGMHKTQTNKHSFLYIEITVRERFIIESGRPKSDGHKSYSRKLFLEKRIDMKRN